MAANNDDVTGTSPNTRGPSLQENTLESMDTSSEVPSSAGDNGAPRSSVNTGAGVGNGQSRVPSASSSPKNGAAGTSDSHTVTPKKGDSGSEEIPGSSPKKGASKGLISMGVRTSATGDKVIFCGRDLTIPVTPLRGPETDTVSQWDALVEVDLEEASDTSEKTGAIPRTPSAAQSFPVSDTREPLREAVANTDVEKAEHSVKELAKKLEHLGKESEPILAFPTKVTQRRFETLKSLLYQLIGCTWSSQRGQKLVSEYNQIQKILRLICAHYTTLLKNQRPDHSGHKSVSDLRSSLDDLAKLKKELELATQVSDQKGSKSKVSIGDLRIFLRNAERNMKVTYTVRDEDARKVPKESAVVTKPTPAPPKDTENTSTQKVAAKPAASKGKGEQVRTVADRFKKPASTSKGPGERTEQTVQTPVRAQAPPGNSGKQGRTGSRAESNTSSILKSPPKTASKRKRSRSSSKAREEPKRNKDMQVDELLGQILSSLKAKLDKNNTGGRKNSKPKVKFAKQVKTQAPRVVDDEANIIIMGDSQVATDIAARLDARLIGSIAHDDHLEQLQEALQEVTGRVKVAFIDYGQHDLDYSLSAAEIRERLEQAGALVTGHCTAQNHSVKRCELVHFQPMSTPSEYVCDSEPDDLDQGNDHTAWYDSMDQMLSDLSHSTSRSFAFTVNLHTRTHSQRNKHFWPNWVQFNPEDLGSKADCSTLVDDVMERVIKVSCKHIKMFDSARGYPVEENE